MILFNDYYFPIIASVVLFCGMLISWISLSLKSKEKIFELNKISKFCIFISNILFAITLFSRWIKESYFPLSNLYESLIFLSWSISSIQLFLEYKTKSRLLSSVITPILFFLSSFSSLTLPIEMQKALPLVPSLQSNWLMMHVSMMMVSYATLLVGSLLSILYLSFENFSFSFEFSKQGNSNLLKLETSSISKSSLLETLDIWSYRIIGLGFPFLTLGIISGAVWANEAWGSYWSWDPKETWALITWLIFAIYLHSRIIKGWQGKKAASVGSFGFFVIWICYLGVNFLAKGLHTYGWILS
jgi:cytochrome c-type biogenesis protein CcsB